MAFIKIETKKYEPMMAAVTKIQSCTSILAKETPNSGESADAKFGIANTPTTKSAATPMTSIMRNRFKGSQILNRMIKPVNVKPSTSMPNWSALFSGTAPENQNVYPFPSIFTLAKNSEEESKSVIFHEWEELQSIFPAEMIETRIICSDIESALLIADYIAEEKPFFTAVVMNEPDSIGHKKRWGSAAYYARLAELDSLIGIMVQATKNAGIYDSTVFVLSSDHGGVFWGHGFNSSRQRRIPLIIYGSGIKEGYAIPAKHSICDIAPTMAAILGLEIPSEWTGQPIQGIFR